MMDITEIIIDWAWAANKLWCQSFSRYEDGDHDFLEFEENLFRFLVLKRVNQQSLSREAFFKRCNIEYPQGLAAERSFFRTENTKNLIGLPKHIDLEIGSSSRLIDVDPMGLMLDGEPYAEVKYENGFFLEPLNSNNLFLIHYNRK